jgi:hypothetical protein
LKNMFVHRLPSWPTLLYWEFANDGPAKNVEKQRLTLEERIGFFLWERNGC